MTTLAIMATYEKKRLKCYGTVAAGEHVAVTVTDGAQWIGEGKALRLRVLFGPDTVGVFPFADGDAWTATGTQNADAYCELNLNTLQAEKYLKHGGTCLWILDDVENHMLYATGEFDVLPWPKRRGIDEPIDLDGYPLLLDEIKDLKEAFEEYQRTVAQALAAKQDTIFDLAAIRSGAAAGATAVQPSQIARFVDDAEYKAQYGEQNKPAILLKHGTNVIVALDATPFVRDGMVSDVKVENGNLVITFNTDSGKRPISIPLTDIFNPANYYDKTAADGKFVAKEAGKGLSTEDYTTAEKTKLGGIAAGAQVNVIETVKVNGTALTPQSKAVDIPVPVLDDTVTPTSANGVKSSGIWSAIWGTLAALPAGFTSLYDWCVAQLAGKMPSTATGADIPIDAMQGAQKIDIAFTLVNSKADEALFVLNGKANRAANPTAGNLAALDANGNPTDSQIPKSDIESLIFANYYPDGSVKSAADLTSGIKYDFNDTDRTASALPFCNTGTGEDNHDLTGRVVIPSFVDRQGNPYISDDGTKYKVVEVADDMTDGFGNSGLTDIIAPTTVTRVGVNSFCGCGDLVSASFPGVTAVDLYAFYDCSSLESIALPLAVTIGDESFEGCSALASVAFPGATSIGSAAFLHCSSLASATLPAVTSIEVQSFADCSALVSVALPSVRTIGPNAFANCSALASIELPSATGIEDKAFWTCSSLKSAALPSVRTIGPNAFANCSALASIELPSATGIGANAFWTCSSLKSAALPSATTIGVAAFANCEAIASIYIPSATAIGDSAFYHCLALDVLDFGSAQSVPTLGVGAFQDVPTTCKIVVPDAQYSVWVAASGWSGLVTAGYKFLRHSEWERARKYDLPYDLVTKTPDGFGIVILDDHAQNIVSISSALATLTIGMPTATPGKVRDCGLRINIAAGITAPEVSLFAGETGGFYTSDGEIPVIADGGADGAVTILCFTEVAKSEFLVKAESVKPMAQR